MLKNNSIALHAICKDEDYYIEEWIDYHSGIGIDYFILYDNNSDISLKNKLSEYKNVRVIQWTDSREATQLRSQKHCIIHNQNFRWIGFLNLIFPNSKIIHCERDPKNNCLSMFKNLFEGGLNFTYDQNDLVDYYNAYLDLMNYWKSYLEYMYILMK